MKCGIRQFMKKALAVLLFAIPLLLSVDARADQVVVGDLEFNNLFSGVNNFTVNNFTGTNNLGFFPVADDVIFYGATIAATESDGTVLLFALGDIVPGSNTSAQFADSLVFTQAVFSAALGSSTFNLTNGSTGAFDANTELSFTLMPSNGAFLVAGIDLGTINASGTPVAATPEPSPVLLSAFGLLAILKCRARRRAAS